MPNGAAPPFGQPDGRTAEARGRDRAKARTKAARMAEWRANRTRRREDLYRLRDRRDQSPNAEKFDVLEPDDDSEFLVVRDRLLTTVAALDDPDFRTELDEAGLERDPAPEVHARLLARVAVLRWIPGRQHDEVEDVLSTFASSRHRVTRTYLAPLGPVMKSHQTPEPTELPWPVRPRPGRRPPVAVAVVDTGLDFQRRPDKWLENLLADSEQDHLDTIPAPDGVLDAGAGHGTFVAGVVQQIVPDAEIRVYQALDTDGLASELHVASTIVRAVDEMLTADGRLVVNLSLGSETVDDRPPLALEAAAAVVGEIAAEKRGEVLLVAAAGNEGRERECWPAAFPEVVAVAGLMPDMTPATFSSRGAWVKCSTIAAGVRGPYVEGQESGDWDDDPETWQANTWAQWTGTSFAAPQVSGAVAKLAGSSGTPLTQALANLLAGGSAVAGFGTAVRILG